MGYQRGQQDLSWNTWARLIPATGGHFQCESDSRPERHVLTPTVKSFISQASFWQPWAFGTLVKNWGPSDHNAQATGTRPNQAWPHTSPPTRAPHLTHVKIVKCCLAWERKQVFSDW